MLGLSPQNESGLGLGPELGLTPQPASALAGPLALQFLEEIFDFPLATAAAGECTSLAGNFLHIHTGEVKPADLSTLGTAAKAEGFVVGIIGFAHAPGVKVDVKSVMEIQAKSYFTPALHSSSATRPQGLHLARHDT